MLSTYLIYNFILFGSVFFAYLYEKSSRDSTLSIFWYGVTFFIPFIFLAIRYDIGTDYRNYVNYYYWINELGIATKEPGYLLVNYTIAYFNLDIQWLFVFFGFFTMLFSYKALPKRGFAVGIFLFVTIFYLYEGYSAIRQGLSIAIMAYASKYIYEKKPLYYFAWGLVALMFHSITAILLMLLYPVANTKTNKFILVAVLVFVFVLVISTNAPEKMLAIATSLFPKYIWYLESAFSGAAQTSFGIVGPIIKISLIIGVLLFKDKIIAKYPIANIYLNFLFIYSLTYLFHTKVQIFGRVEHVFIFFLILSMVYLVKTISTKFRGLIVVIVLGFYFLLFLRYIANGTIDVNNTVHISPYQTIFSRPSK